MPQPSPISPGGGSVASGLSSLTLPRRSLFKTLGAVGAAGSIPWLTGCSSGSKQTVLFHASKPEAVPRFRQWADDFTASQDNYRILHDLATQLSASFVRNNPPDVGMINYNLEMARFMERGALSDLRDMPEAERIRPDIVELTKAYPQFEDRVSVLPYSAMAASVIYNKQIFADNGLEVPETWDALIEVCEKLKANGVTPFYATFMDPWTIAQGWVDYPVGGMVDVAEFYREMNANGLDVTPESEVSFSSTFLAPIQKMLELIQYTNSDKASKGYGDGNTAFANGAGAMIMQGPWAFSEFDKVGKDLDLGTFPLPVTDSADDLKVRVNIDLTLWIPEMSDAREGAREFVQYLFQPEIQHPYNADFLGFGTTTDAPPVTDERIVGMQPYYDSGRFYMGASQFIPRGIPYEIYFQDIALGRRTPEDVLAQMDRDWARLAFRA